MSIAAAIQRLRRMPSHAVAGIALTLIAALSFALAGFIASRIARDGTAGVTIAFFEALFGLLFVLLVVSSTRSVTAGTLRTGWQWGLPAILWLLLASVATAAGFGGFYSSLNYEDLSVVSPIMGTVPLVSYALILVLLRGEERITGRVLLGAVLVVAGVVIIGLNN